MGSADGDEFVISESPRNIVLVSRFFHESRSPSGQYVASLARGLSSCGHRVHIVSPISIVPQVRHAFDGLIAIHRLGSRRGSPALAFGVLAARKVHDLVQTQSCDVIMCIDSPEELVAIDLMISLGNLPTKLIAATTNHERRSDPELTMLKVCHAHITVGHEADSADEVNAHSKSSKRNSTPIEIPYTCSIPAPLDHTSWDAPADVYRSIIACDMMTDSQQRALVTAYEQSRACRRGWILKIRGRVGDWSTSASDFKDKRFQSCNGSRDIKNDIQPCIFVSLSPSFPTSIAYALKSGWGCVLPHNSGLHVETSLPSTQIRIDNEDPNQICEAIDKLADRMDDHPRNLYESGGAESAQVVEISNKLDKIYSVETVIEAHERVWERLVDTDRINQHASIEIQRRVDVWRAVESGEIQFTEQVRSRS
jgi:hypothetical protein